MPSKRRSPWPAIGCSVEAHQDRRTGLKSTCRYRARSPLVALSLFLELRWDSS